MTTSNLASTDSLLTTPKTEAQVFDTSTAKFIKTLSQEELNKLKSHHYFHELGSINFDVKIFLHTEDDEDYDANSIKVYEIEFESYEKILQDEYVYRIYGVFDNVTLSIPIDAYSAIKTHNSGLAILTRADNLLLISLNDDYQLLNLNDENVLAHKENYAKRVRNIIHHENPYLLAKEYLIFNSAYRLTTFAEMSMKTKKYGLPIACLYFLIFFVLFLVNTQFYVGTIILLVALVVITFGIKTFFYSDIFEPAGFFSGPVKLIEKNSLPNGYNKKKFKFEGWLELYNENRLYIPSGLGWMDKIKTALQKNSFVTIEFDANNLILDFNQQMRLEQEGIQKFDWKWRVHLTLLLSVIVIAIFYLNTEHFLLLTDHYLIFKEGVNNQMAIGSIWDSFEPMKDKIIANLIIVLSGVYLFLNHLVKLIRSFKKPTAGPLIKLTKDDLNELDE